MLQIFYIWFFRKIVLDKPTEHISTKVRKIKRSKVQNINTLFPNTKPHVQRKSGTNLSILSEVGLGRVELKDHRQFRDKLEIIKQTKSKYSVGVIAKIGIYKLYVKTRAQVAREHYGYN